MKLNLDLDSEITLSVRQLRMLFVELFDNDESDLVRISNPVDFSDLPEFKLYR